MISGHTVASFVQDRLADHLSSQNLREAPERGITDGVKKMCEELSQTTINVAFSDFND